MKNHKKTILLDFDGVIHSYTSGWMGPKVIPDPPVKDAIEWITNIIYTCCTLPDSIAALRPDGVYELHIYSSRARYWGGVSAMKSWLVRWGLDSRLLEVIKFPKGKPDHYLFIDDRAMRFNGHFPSPEQIAEFKPWYK